jgi:HD superfamily phosphodiesterase
MPSPVRELSTKLFEKYGYPDYLREHSRIVGAIARTLAEAHVARGARIDIDTVVLAALLHDIGRSPLMKGDPREHNELSALILAAEGLGACAEPARRHAIYGVLDPASTPSTLEEKIVFVADRRGGMGIEDLAERAKDTAARHPRFTDDIARAVPIAKRIEAEVFAGLPFGPDELASHVAL